MKISSLCAAVALVGPAACGPLPAPPAACQRVIVDVPEGVVAFEALGFGVPELELPEVGAAVVCVGDAAIEGLEVEGLNPRPDPVMTTMQAAAPPDQWHVGQVDASDAWAKARGAGATVTVVDTGIDCTHSDLVRRCAPGDDPAGGRPQGPNLPGDGHGHGTHVAGTVLSIAPDASVRSCRALDDFGQGYLSTIAWCVTRNARRGEIISMSLGGPTTDRVLDDSVAAAVAAGATVIAARGNGGNQTPLYPACIEGVLGVAATTRSDARASFSSYGPCTDVAAPGDNITATRRGGGYVSMSGTSMATPIVSGIAALLASIGAVEVLTPIVIGMDPVSDRALPGRVNAYRSVSLAEPGVPLPTATPGPSPVAPPTVTPVEPYPPYPGPETPTSTPLAVPRTRTPVPVPPTRTPTPGPVWNTCAEVGLKEIEVRGLFSRVKVCQGRPPRN